MSTRPDLSEPERRARAVLTVAAGARDADDLRELLGMLGLDPAEGLPKERRPAPALPPQRGKRGNLLVGELAALLVEAALDGRSA